MTAATQLDLFGEVERAEQEAAAWLARFKRADWVAPQDCGYGPAGTVVPGWRCPDPECGEVEPNGYLLWITHGWNPDMPGEEPYDGRCHKLRLARAQAKAEADVAL